MSHNGLKILDKISISIDIHSVMIMAQFFFYVVGNNYHKKRNFIKSLKIKTMKNLVFLLVVGVILTLSSCQKEDLSSTKPSSSTTVVQTKTEQLKVASEFNWKTYKDVQITLTGSTNNIVQVTSANQTVYQQAFLAKDQAYAMKITVPSYETSVHLLYMGKDVTLKLNSGNINYKFN